MDTNSNIDNELENTAEIRPDDEFNAKIVDTPEDFAVETANETEYPAEFATLPETTVVNEPNNQIKAVPAVSASSSNSGMSALAKGLSVIVVILLIGAGLVFWKMKVGGSGGDLTHLTDEDMQILLKDANPMQLKALAENPEQKKKIAENIKQLLAVASQARKDGIAEDPNVKQELENIREVITATVYDQKVNKDKGPMPQFGYISEDQVKAYWDENPAHEEEFKKFLDSKLAIAKEDGKLPADKELTEEETKQAKDDFAKIMIYNKEAEEKGGELGEDFKHEVNLQVKLQQAQFLASRYAQKVLAEKVKVTDEDVQKYIADHPELSPKEKKAKAEQILSRAKAGEDFAKLANENSEDPGNKNPQGELQGGLYKDVPKGKMMPAFEQAALALQPGQIADNLVETPYGYHIIKLEKKTEGKDEKGQPTETYDVRHILISTTMKDPTNPMGREMPVTEMVRAQLEKEKQKKVLDEIVAGNPIEVPEDFKVPEPSQEDLQQMQQQMQQQQMQGMPQGMQPPSSAPQGKMPPKPEPKKK